MLNVVTLSVTMATYTKLGWESVAVTNTLAYHDTELTMAVNSTLLQLLLDIRVSSWPWPQILD